MDIRKILLIFIYVFLSFFGFSQQEKAVEWLSFADAFAKQKQDPKPILVDVYTDWCGWCKKMDKDTYGDRDIISFVNKSFYPVKFNAETKSEILYNGKAYNNTGNGKKSTHELASLLLNNKMSYPATVFITADSKVFPVFGYMPVSDFEPLLAYLSENIYNSSEYVEFKREFDNAFNPNIISTNEAVINWLNIGDAYQKQKAERKKIFLYIHSEFTYASKTMFASSLKHPYIANFLDSNFYPVKLDFDCLDTLYLGNDVFVNSQNSLGYPNDLVIALLRPDFRYPAVLFFDEDFNLLFTLRGFYSPETLERYLNFVVDEKYKDKTISFKHYFDTFQSKIQGK